jgi:nucleotide-binding universal stress UspA family protein
MRPPAKVLVATDLGARSDRAVDRAAQLAGQWHAELLVLHVLEPSSTTTLSTSEIAAKARVELVEQIPDHADRTSIRIERGRAAEVVPAVARAAGAGLIVTGVARNEAFGRLRLGDTVDGVLHRLEGPLLVVSRRARAPYRRITVAVDLAEVSRRALAAAAALFPGTPLTVFHAHDAPGGYMASDLARHRAQYTAAAQAQLDGFLADLPDDVRARLGRVVEFGDPVRQLVARVEANATELVVLGTRSRGPIGELFLGSVAKRILTALPCDVLVVPPGAG